MQFASLLFAFALLLFAFLLLLGLYDVFRASRVWQKVRVERTRSAWADAREQLVELARAEKLSAHSQTFRTFYALQTFVLRRPDAYDELSRKLAEAYLAGTAPLHAWADEVPAWPAEMQVVLGKMKDGTQSLMFGYSGRYLIARHVVKLATWIMVHQGRRVVRAAWNRIPETLRTFAAVNRELQQISSRVGQGRPAPSLVFNEANC